MSYKAPHQIWEKGWLRNKQFCYNSKHHMYNPIIDMIVRDLKAGKNRTLAVVGERRSGKSCFSLFLQCYFNWCFYGRDEYEPSKENLKPIFDLYWKIDDFNNATKNPFNFNKFLTQEEQGVEQFIMEFQNKDLQAYNKINQIFGIDNTNPIINLPTIRSLYTHTRFQVNYILRTIRKSKNRVDVVLCKKWMSVTTEKIRFYPTFVWERVPFIGDYYPKVYDAYIKLKLHYNKAKKEELTSRGQPSGKQERFFIN